MFEERTSPRARALVALGVALALIVGLAVGRTTAPGGVSATAAGPGGVQTGFPQTRSGARAAALEFTAARLRSVLLPPKVRRAMYGAIGTPEFARRAILEDGDTDLAAVGGSAGDLRYLTSGLGSRLDLYAAGRARVAVWALRALSGVPFPVASFSTQVVDLRWSGSDWQVTGMREAAQQAVPRVLQTGAKGATNAVLSGLAPATYGTP